MEGGGGQKGRDRLTVASGRGAPDAEQASIAAADGIARVAQPGGAEGA